VASRGRRGDASRGGFPAAGDGGAGDSFGSGGGGFDGGDSFDGGADDGGAGQRTVNGVLADGTDAGPAEPTPVLAVVGRPNVGKSTMVNRILGSRQAVVEDTPGVTRDRVTYDATWRGRAFTLVDTGGWDPEVERQPVLAARVAAQARVAVDAADAVLFVVDAVVGITDADAAVAAVLRRSGKPVVVAANKVDDAPGESNVGSLWALGLGEPQSVSALHGRGSGDLLDAILEALPPAPGERFDLEAGPRRVALIGRPNVGKSSLLNRLAGEERVLVDSVAGTTRDPVDELVELGGKTWRFVDTAGIRRRMRETQGADYFAALRTERALERAEVAVVLVDASEPLTEQDLRIISMVIDAGRALVIAYNKWDLVDEDRREALDREIDRQLYTARWAPRVNVSAATGWHVERLVPALETALTSWETRVQTGRLNAWLTALIAATPPPVRGGKQPKIMFATQAGIRPPHFVLFTSGFLQAGYRRFIERRLREEFGFDGTPVHVTMRLREKRSGAGGRAAGGARRS
jgi:GTP-binding protein